MKPILLLLLLGAVILVKASYMPTESPEAFRRRMMQPTPPTPPSWLRGMPMVPTGLPLGYSLTDTQIREREQEYRREQDKLRGARKARWAQDDEEIALEKRRNLLVGRYGFRIGKRDANEDLTEADYEELIAEGDRDPSKAFLQ